MWLGDGPSVTVRETVGVSVIVDTAVAVDVEVLFWVGVEVVVGTAELVRVIVGLKVKVSSHTPLHADQAAEFAEIIREIPLVDPKRPIVSNISSRPLVTAEDIRGEFAAQLRSPVFWTNNVHEMSRQGVDTFVEVGPGHVLSRMVKRVQDSFTAISLDDATEPPIPISALPENAAPEGAR